MRQGCIEPQISGHLQKTPTLLNPQFCNKQQFQRQRISSKHSGSMTLMYRLCILNIQDVPMLPLFISVTLYHGDNRNKCVFPRIPFCCQFPCVNLNYSIIHGFGFWPSARILELQREPPQSPPSITCGLLCHIPAIVLSQSPMVILCSINRFGL